MEAAASGVDGQVMIAKSATFSCSLAVQVHENVALSAILSRIRTAQTTATSQHRRHEPSERAHPLHHPIVDHL